MPARSLSRNAASCRCTRSRRRYPTRSGSWPKTVPTCAKRLPPPRRTARAATRLALKTCGAVSWQRPLARVRAPHRPAVDPKWTARAILRHRVFRIERARAIVVPPRREQRERHVELQRAAPPSASRPPLRLPAFRCRVEPRIAWAVRTLDLPPHRRSACSAWLGGLRDGGVASHASAAITSSRESRTSSRCRAATWGGDERGRPDRRARRQEHRC